MLVCQTQETIRARPEQIKYIEEMKRIHGLKALHEAVQILIERDIRCNKAKERNARKEADGKPIRERDSNG